MLALLRVLIPVCLTVQVILFFAGSSARKELGSPTYSRLLISFVRLLYVPLFFFFPEDLSLYFCFNAIWYFCCSVLISSLFLFLFHLPPVLFYLLLDNLIF